MPRKQKINYQPTKHNIQWSLKEEFSRFLTDAQAQVKEQVTNGYLKNSSSSISKIQPTATPTVLYSKQWMPTTLTRLKGAEVTVNFGHNVREYQGRFYNSLRVFSMEFAGDAPQQPVAAAQANVAPAPQPQAQGEDDDDLPF